MMLAIARIEKHDTTAREISSRSAKVSAKEDRHRFGGGIPPVRHRMPSTDECDRSNN